MKEVSNKEILEKVQELAYKIKYEVLLVDTCKIYGVPRGGIPVAYMLLRYVFDSTIVNTPEEADIIVDDIEDSGETKARYIGEYDKPFFTLYRKPKEWLVFPWERSNIETPMEDNITRIKQYLVGDIKKNEKEKVGVLLKDLINKFDL